MKRLLLFSFLGVLCALAACSGGKTAPVAAGPHLAIPDSEFVFGNVPRDGKVSHAYWLYSTGTDTVEITKVRSSCGCTKAPLQQQSLAPGDSMQFEVIFTASSIPGKAHKGVSIFTNEKDVDYHPATFVAWVIPWPDSTLALRLWPDKIRFVNGGPKKLRVSIKNEGASEYKLRVVDEPPALKVDCPEKIAAGGDLEMTVNYVGDAIEDSANKSFTIEAVGPDTTRFSLPVWLEPAP